MATCPHCLKEIAAKSGHAGGPIAGHNEVVADGTVRVSPATYDVEVDPGRSPLFATR